MSVNEGDETAKLWKVNKTIHELVKDRVRFASTLPTRFL